MNTKTLIVLAGLAASLAATPAFAAKSTYTCTGGTPCIVESKELGKHRVLLKWSGQGKKYDYYKLTIRQHGGGAQKQLRLPGGKIGHQKFDLKKPGDYEFFIAGCTKAKKGEKEVCKPSSEHVRLNLR